MGRLKSPKVQNCPLTVHESSIQLTVMHMDPLHNLECHVSAVSDIFSEVFLKESEQFETKYICLFDYYSMDSDKASYFGSLAQEDNEINQLAVFDCRERL